MIRWAGASLAVLAAAPAAAQDATWSTTPENVIFGGRSDYQDPDNWVPAAVPTGTATFGPTAETDIFFDNQVDQQPIEVGRFVFTADAPAYTFTLQSDEFTFTGEGIVNNSANAQTLLSGNRSILRFANASSAGNAHITVFGGTGRLFFQDNSSAASSTITVGASDSAGIVAFSGNATAGNATIDNGLGNVNFIGSSSAGDATINNSSGLVFGDSSSLGTARITGLAGGIRIFGAANGPDATIINQAGSTLDVSQLDDGPQDLAIGSLSGAGSVLLGGRNLVLGNLGLNDILSGTIADGGDLGGTGGALTKIGAGTLTLTGASTYTGDTSVTGGTLTLTGSIDGTDEVIVGRAGTGTLIVEGGGTLASTGTATIGAFGGNGTMLVTGSGSAWTTNGVTIGLPPLLVDTSGAGGTGRLNIENGASVTSATAGIFQNSFAGIDGKATVTGGGTVWNTGALGISSAQRLELLTITAGATVNSTTSTIAGGVRVAGAGSTWNSGDLALGPNLNANGTPPGILTIAEGGVVNSSSAFVDDGGGLPSSVTVEGAGSAWNVTGDLSVALNAFSGGSIAIRNGGTVAIDGGSGDLLLGTSGGTTFLTIGGGAPGTTPGNLEAASVELGANSILAFEYASQSHVFAPVIAGAGRIFAGSGTTIVTGDSAAFAGTTRIFAGATLKVGTFTVSGGGVGLGTGGQSGALGGDIVNDGALIFARNGALVIDGTISGTGTVTNIGGAAARTTLTAVSSYTGATTVDGGALQVDGSIAASAVRVNGGGTLAGTGTVGSTEAFGGGTLAPGAAIGDSMLSSVGTLNVSGNLTLDSANYFADVAPAAADRVAVSGNMLLDGRLVAIAAGGDYAPGQYTLLTSSGRAGTFDILTLDGNFSGLAASLSYAGTNVVLTLAEFTATGEERWLADPATNDWNTGANWNPAAVPDGTARFGPSTRTTVGFSRGTTQIGRILLDADAPAYTFQLDSGRRSEGGGDSLSFLGEGIVNNSAFRPTFQVVSIDTVAGGGGAINFFNSSSAGNAHISSFNSGNIFSSTTTFYQTSSAGTAILDNVGQGVSFRDSSTAADATINNGSDGGLAGATAFFDDSSAGNAIITNPIDLGGVIFLDSSTAGSAQILNRATATFDFAADEPEIAGIIFADTADAGNATITNESGNTAFVDTSSAANAILVNSGAASFSFSTLFGGASSAGSATITNDEGGITIFQEASTAASATIVNNAGGATAFFRAPAQTGLAYGTPILINNSGGTTFLRGHASGDAFTIVNNAGGLVDISEDPEEAPQFVAPAVAIGSLSGDGDVALGARTLILGDLNRDEAIGGEIRDGGQFEGSGGSLTKVGTGTLTLAGASTYTGDTRVDAGTLIVTGSLAGTDEVTVGRATSAALVIQGGGTVVSSGRGLIGVDQGSGTVTVTGAGSSWTAGGAIEIGLYSGPDTPDKLGTGRLIITEGATVTSNGALISYGETSGAERAVVDGAGSSWTTGALRLFGLDFDETLLAISAGGRVNSSSAQITGEARATGEGSVWNTGDLLIGKVNSDDLAGTAGKLLIQDGAVVNSGEVVAQDLISSLGVGVTVEGAGSAWNVSGDASFGDGQSTITTLTIRDGGLVSIADGTGYLSLGADPEAGFTPLNFLTIGGSATTAPGTLAAGEVEIGGNSTLLFSHNADDHLFAPRLSGAGTVTVRDGTTILTANSTGYAGATGIETGGTLQLGNGGGAGALGGDIANAGRLVIDRAGTLTLAGVISGSGSLSQNGPGTTTLSAANTYAGPTLVNDGTLLVTGSIAGSTVTVNDGATLGGNGTTGDTNIAAGGLIAPGLSIGTLTVDGNLILGNGNYLAEVSPTAADLIDVAGSASLDGILTAIATGGAYAPGEFILLTADGGRTGTFDSLQTQGSFSGLAVTLGYQGNNVILTLATAVGEPDWTGAVSTDWFVNGNWDNNAVPTAGVAVTINTDTPNPTVIAAAGAVSGSITIGGVAGQTGDLTIQGGGTLATGGQAIVGTGGGVGEVLVTGAGSRWTITGGLLLAAPSAGSGTLGTLRIESGATVTSDSTQLNQLATRSSRAVASGSGTTWNTGNFNANGLANLVGDMVTVEAGATVVSTQSALASRMTVTGAGTSWTSGALLVGSSSGINPGRLAILDGAAVDSSTAQLGFSPVGAGSGSTSRGVVDVSAATWNVGANLIIGINEFNVGTLVIRNGGTVTIAAGAGEALVGPNSALTIGGTATAAPGLLDAVAVDLDPAALLTFSHDSEGHVFAPVIRGGGDIAVTIGTTILTADHAGFTGTTTIGAVIPELGRGGVLQLGDGGATGALGSDIVNDNQLVIDRTGTLTLGGIVSGTGSLTQNGTVTTTLSAASSYTGATIVNGGTLLVTGAIAGSAVTVNAGATLGGTGTVGSAAIADGGTIAPGMSIGTLSIAGNLLFGDGSVYRAEVSPTASDLIDVAGTASLAGTVQAVATDGPFTAGRSYTILTADGGISGTFGAVTMEGDFGGFAASLRYDASNVSLVLGKSGPTNTATTSFSDALVFNSPTVTVERVSLFETRIIGRLDGGAPLFDETYDAAFDSPLVQQGVQSARLAVTAAGGPGVVVLVSDPVLTSRNVTSTTASTSLFSLAETRQSVTTTTTFGPATVTIGDAQSCGDAIAALPSGTRPACATPGGQAFNVEPGTVNINVITQTDYVIDEARTDTTTETIRETYELTGTVVPVGSVHAAVLSGLYDLSARLLHRIGAQGAAAPFGGGAPDAGAASRLAATGGGGGWAEAYGFRNRADARGGLPAERRDAWGLAGGFSLAAGEGIMIGFGVDHGQLDLDVPDAVEQADIELTQLAVGARLGSGPFSLAVSASYGFGSVDSSRSLIALATAAYDVDSLGLFAEASYAFEAGAWRIVPSLGIDHVRIETDDFTETGALGLSVPGQDSDRTRLVPGVEAGRSFALGGGGALDISGSVQYLALLGGEERTLPVAFSIAPGTPLVMRGLPERDSALIGAQARLRLTPSLDLYLAYDGRFAGGYDAHGATAGLRFVW